MQHSLFAALRRSLTSDLHPSDAATANKLRFVDATLSVLSDNDSVETHLTPDPIRDALFGVGQQDDDPPAEETVKVALAAIDDNAEELLRRKGTALIRRESGERMFLDRANPDALRNVELSLVFERLSDRFGRDFDIGILTPAIRLAVLPAAGQPPVLLFTSARKPNSGGQTISITGGTVWIAARLLAPATSPDGFVGLRVSGGSLSLSAGVTLDGDDVILGGPLDGELSVDPIAVAGSSARVDAPPPATLGIAFSSGSAPIAEFPESPKKADDVSLNFRATGGIRHEAAPNEIVLECEVGPASVDTAAFALETVTFTGATGLSDGGFAIPVTLTDTPRTLPEAAGEHAWTARFEDAVGVRWRGGPTQDTRIEDARLSIGPACYMIETLQAIADNPGSEHVFTLWRLPDLPHRAKLKIKLAEPFPAVFGCAGDGGDLIRFTGLLDARLGRPVDATGAPIPTTKERVVVQIAGPADDQKVAMIPVGSPPDLPFRRRMMALENAYLAVGRKRLALLIGHLTDGREIFDAAAGVLLPVFGWIPTLPDPYVDNLAVDRDDLLGREARTLLIGIFRWETGAAEFGFLGLLPRPTAGEADRSEPSTGPAPPNKGNPLYRSQTDQGAVLPNRSRFDFDFTADRFVAAAAQPPRGDPVGPTVEAIANFGEDVEGAGILRRGCYLLDVSTARHQIGVQIDTHANFGSDILGAGLFVYGYQLAAPLTTLRVFALPQIQWEPVRTLPKDQDPVTLGIFPTPLASADDGGATVFASEAAMLAPAIPELTLDSQIAGLGTGNRLNVVSTLPFGMKMLVKLRPSGPKRDSVELVQPVFPTEDPLKGGLQVSLRSEANVSRRVHDQSAAFEGRTVQLPNGMDLDSGAALDISVLGATVGSAGSVETLFNQEFGGANARVPLTRFDISGYGASTFSDWTNPKGSFAETTRANFQVVVGRTLLEIVKVASVLYPWGIRVTRSVTIERRGGGGVVRRDSGWQAQTSGLFDFTTDTVPAQPYEIHPGLIRGIYDIDRIRPAGEELTLPGTGRVLPMAFDATVQIDGAADRTRAEALIGFLHLAHQTPLPPGPGQPLSVPDLAELVSYQGGIGGPVDADIDVGGSGFRARATRIEVALAERAGQPVFVGAVQTMPILGTAGSWAVVRGPGASAATGGDFAAATDGAPVVREGAAQPATTDKVNAPGIGRYRILAPGDLFSGANPETEFALLQADTTHRFIFRRPEIPAGQARIVSPVPPAFADYYAAATSKGLFPPIGNAIELVDHPYELTVQGGTGYLALTPDVSVPTPRGDLILSESANDRFRVGYDNSELNFQLRPDSWSLEFAGLEVWTETPDLPNMTGSRAIVRGGTSQRAQLDEVEVLMSPVLEDLLSILPGLNERGKYGPYDLGASNLKISPKISAGFDKVFPDGEIFAIRLFALLEIGIENELKKSDEYLFIGVKAGFDARFSIPIEPYPVAVIFGFAYSVGGKVLLTGPDSGKGKAIIEMRLYVGVAFGKELGPFKAAVATGFGMILIFGTETGIGGFVFLEIKAKINPVVSIKVFGEFAFLQIEKADGQKYQRYTGFVGINVSIFMIISIKFQADISDEKKI